MIQLRRVSLRLLIVGGIFAALFSWTVVARLSAWPGNNPRNWRSYALQGKPVDQQTSASASAVRSYPSPASLYVATAVGTATKQTASPSLTAGGSPLADALQIPGNRTHTPLRLSQNNFDFAGVSAISYPADTELQRAGGELIHLPDAGLRGSTSADATASNGEKEPSDRLANSSARENLKVGGASLSATGSRDSGDGMIPTELDWTITTPVTRGPYLQSGTPTSVVVRWRTEAAVVGWVAFGTNLSGLNLTRFEAFSTRDHVVRLTGLLPDTKYFYSIGSGTGRTADGDANTFFVTSPVPGTPKATRVWVIGDSGTGTTNQINVRNAYERFTGARHTDLWLMLGDNAYPNGTDAEYQSVVFNVYTNLLRKSVLWSTLGNHETAELTAFNDSYPYFNLFTFPQNGEAGGLASGSEHYYSFDYGNIHFICLDSMTAELRATNSVMFEWLTNDLANVTADWTIAFWHHPPYSKGTHDSDFEYEQVQMRRVFLPVLESAGVDLVLAGHSHSYERSFLLDQHYGTSWALTDANKLERGSGREEGTGAYRKPEGGPIGHRGAVYAVVGSSGDASDSDLNHPAMYVSVAELGSLVLDVAGTRLDAKFIRENGTTNDSFTILKVNYPPIASNLTFTVASDTSTNLFVAASDPNRQPVTFGTSSSPGEALISAFDPTLGTFRFTPARGFIGTASFEFWASDGHTNSLPATARITVLAPPDLNANGLPDSWETAWNLTDPNADEDGDGLTNLQEYQANTNPTNAASALRILGLERDAGGNFIVSWESIGGTRYRVSYSDGDAAGSFNGHFTELAQPVTVEMDASPIGTPGTMMFKDDFTLTGGAAHNGARYYRIRVVR